VSYYSSSTVPDISTVWSNTPKTREETREHIRRILNVPVSLEGLGNLTRNMNSAAELSPAAVAQIEASLVEHETLEQQRTDAQSKAAWDGSAPLKKADVVEYDTSLLADPNAIVTQTQGINARMGQIEMEIRVSLGMGHAGGSARLYRS